MSDRETETMTLTVSKIEFDHILGSLRLLQLVMESWHDGLLAHVHEVLTDIDSRSVQTIYEISDLRERINTGE